MKGYHTHVIFEAIELIFKVITGDAPYIVLPIVILLVFLLLLCEPQMDYRILRYMVYGHH